MQAPGQTRRRSQFSLVSDGVRRTSHSSRRLPSEAGTEQSYDLYKPSRYQITNPYADHANITVLRNASAASQRRPIPSHGDSVIHPAVARIQGENIHYNISSSPPPLPTKSYASSGRYSIDSSRRNFSRSSIASSQRRRESSVIRKSVSYKRKVIFSHERKRSASETPPVTRIAAPPAIPPRKHHRPQNSSSSPNFTSEIASAQATTSPIVFSRKERETQAYERLINETVQQKNSKGGFWRDEARIVSNELARFCDQAFMERHDASHLTIPPSDAHKLSTSVIAPRQITSKAEPGASQLQSVSTQVDNSPAGLTQVKPLRVKKSIDKETLLKRPLPEPPRGEVARSRTQIELAAMKKKLERRAAELAPGALDDVFAHFDRLMEPSSQESLDPASERRMSSAPDPNHGILSPVREEDEEVRRFGVGSSRRRHEDHRAASDPTSHRHNSNDVSPTRRRGKRDKPSIRIVREDSGLRVPPLVIRKKSDSLPPLEQQVSHRPSREQLNQRRAITGVPQSQEPRAREHASRLMHDELPPRPQSRLGFNTENSVGLSLLQRQLDPIEEDEDKDDEESRGAKRSSGDSKARQWFRRIQQRPKSVESDKGPTPLVKDDKSTASYGSRNEERTETSSRDAFSNEFDEVEPKKEKSTSKSRFFNIFTNKRGSKAPELALSSTFTTPRSPRGQSKIMLTETTERAIDDDEFVIDRSNATPTAWMSGALDNDSTTSFISESYHGISRPWHPVLNRTIQPQPQNWLARFLNIQPGVRVLALRISRSRARTIITGIFADWQRHGMRDIIVDKRNARIWAKVGEPNRKSSLYPANLSHSIQDYCR